MSNEKTNSQLSVSVVKKLLMKILKLTKDTHNDFVCQKLMIEQTTHPIAHVMAHRIL